MTYYSIRDVHGSIVCGGPKWFCERHRQSMIDDAQFSIDYERAALPRSLSWCDTHKLRAAWIKFHRERMAKAKARLRYWQAAEIQERMS